MDLPIQQDFWRALCDGHDAELWHRSWDTDVTHSHGQVPRRTMGEHAQDGGQGAAVRRGLSKQRRLSSAQEDQSSSATGEARNLERARCFAVDLHL